MSTGVALLIIARAITSGFTGAGVLVLIPALLVVISAPGHMLLWGVVLAAGWVWMTALFAWARIDSAIHDWKAALEKDG